MGSEFGSGEPCTAVRDMIRGSYKPRDKSVCHLSTFSIRTSCFMSALSISALVCLLGFAQPNNAAPLPRVLVFSKTAAYRHDSISAGVTAVRELAIDAGFIVDATEDAAVFTPENLARYRAVVLLNSSGEILDENQKKAFQDFIHGGGGLAAIHQGITTLEKWPWYVALVGGVKFAGHPKVQDATCRCEIRDHPATKELPASWTWTDEWYNFSPNPRPRTNVLIAVDESSYQGGGMGKDHPISWYHEAEGGRVWCTGFGHTKEGYASPLLRKHLKGGIRYAAGLEPAAAAESKADDRRLDPQARAFLETAKKSGAKGFETLPVDEARKQFVGMGALAGPPEAVDKVTESMLSGGLHARVYSPAGPGPKPALVYFHGGGWVLGSPDTIDGPCRRLANASGCVVISVDYPLAPEHRFPKPLEDCYAATAFIAGHSAMFGVDPQRIAVGGDSAGGNLAAAVTLMARDRKGPAIAFQLLVYPVTNHAFDTPSYRAFREGYGLSEPAMRWFWSQYLARPDDGVNPLASPLRGELRGLPPAFVITAEFDPLRDEGEAYAARLRAAGVRVEARRYDGQLHGFFQMGAVMNRGKQAIDDAAAALRAALGRAPVGADGSAPKPREAVSIDRKAYARYAREHPGDPARGRKLFFDVKGAGCIRCHRSRGEGGDIGPDLSDVGGKYERALLIESVLDPSRQIVEGFRPTVIATADGRVVSGIVKSESEKELVLVDAEGRRHALRKAEIEHRMAEHNSLMPDGLATGLSQRDFADLIAYLDGLRTAGQGSPGSAVAGPISLPPGFSSERVTAGLTGATAIAVADDGRVFVCEQTGALRVVKDGSLLPRPVLNVEVDSHWERGLICVTLDPRFADNGFIYVCYVTPHPYVHHRISRFTTHGDVAISGSELVLFEGDDQAKLGGSEPAGHQGGAIHFGKDGKLYVALGEQTAGIPAQAMTTLQGKLLRLNPDGTIPADNPFYQTAKGKYRAIWALGLRNPFTFAVQPGTGRILINDVGQGTWEEINEGFAGANYGWPMSEGPTSDRRFRGPIHHYSVASIAGGAFCPSGDAPGFPRPYRGKYFFMDFVRGWIKVLNPDEHKQVETFAAGLTRPVDLAFGPDGSLYVLLRDAWVVDHNFRPNSGSLLKICRQASSDEPAANALVRVSEVTIHGDMDCIQVETPGARYLYGKRGAGFASIIDKDGRDWISYRPDGAARGEYRGLPKCGQPTKYFHCGYGYGQYKTDNPFSSRVTLCESTHARIESETQDGKSACQWDFYPDHATLTLLRIDLPTFWFLYEGTPGGKLDATRDFVIRPDGRTTTLDEPWSQVVPWVCFGSAETPVGLVLVNHQAPEPGEADSYVSWPFRKEGNGSFQDMTVFGFGRKGYKELVEHVADLKRLPARYSIAFVDRADVANARVAGERLLTARADREPESNGRFQRLHWFNQGEEHGNPSFAHNKRFRVNAPEVVLHPTFAARAEARGSGMLQILMEEDLRLLEGAELSLELWGGHPGTANRRVTLNGRSTYPIADPGGDTNCTHIYPTIPLKLTDLVNGYNALQFACDQGTSFWGHFIVDEACLRAALKRSHPDLERSGLAGFEATVAATPVTGIDEALELCLGISQSSQAAISHVEFQGHYLGYDENGDGDECDWHGFTSKRKPVAYLGSADAPPYAVNWDLSMLPEQRDMAVRAVVSFKQFPDLVYVTPATRGLATPRRGTRVRIYSTGSIPKPFWSRAGREKTCTIELDVPPDRVERAELHVALWDGGRGTIDNYFTLNGRPLSVAASGKHDVIYSVLRIDPTLLKLGSNHIALRSDTEHHGLEVLLPGPALAVRAKP
jgi:acetyl esterase